MILSHARVGDRLLVNQNLSTENVTIDLAANGLSIVSTLSLLKVQGNNVLF